MGGLGQSIRRFRGRLIIAAVVVAIPVLALAWWLGSPLFINKTVDEEFPFSVNAVVPAGMTQRQIEETMSTMAMMDTEAVAGAMPSMTSDEMMAVVTEEMVSEMMAGMTLEVLAGMAAGEMPEGMAEQMASGVTETMTEMMTEMVAQGEVPQEMVEQMMSGGTESVADMMASMAEMMAAAGPVALKQGMFRDADSFHRGEGSATVYQLPDGAYVLRFEDFRVTNGPDLRVILASHSDPMGRGNVHSGEYVELGKLKGNIGNQNYIIPEGLSPDDYNSVVIYCKPFQVLFSVAPLSTG